MLFGLTDQVTDVYRGQPGRHYRRRLRHVEALPLKPLKCSEINDVQSVFSCDVASCLNSPWHPNQALQSMSRWPRLGLLYHWTANSTRPPVLISVCRSQEHYER